jgi:hypothetical protein
LVGRVAALKFINGLEEFLGAITSTRDVFLKLGIDLVATVYLGLKVLDSAVYITN